MKHGAIALIAALAAFPAAGAPVLQQPIDCELGETCYIQNYVDVDPSEAWSDFACGGLSYDGHKGTDFALPTLKDMQKGVPVLAASDGVVAGTRDGMADAGLTATTAESIQGRECGNGVAIDHGDGWVTQYCHLRKGSVTVRKGATIRAGDMIGLVGLSGKTEFPHLHISVRHNGTVIDPFTPNDPLEACGGDASAALWGDDIGYQPGGIVRLGWDVKVPAYEDVKSGKAGSIPISSDAPAIVLFTQGFGSRAGDRLIAEITGPAGFTFRHAAEIGKSQALYFRATGKKRRGSSWPAGFYEGTVTLERQGQVYDQRKTTLEIR